MGRLVALFGTMVMLYGCGGGGGGGSAGSAPQPTSAVITLSTQGALPSGTAIAGIGVTVNLPPGVTVPTDGSGGVGSDVIVGSGQTASRAVVTVANFQPATATSPGMLRIVLASSEPGGFMAGEYATVKCGIAAGSRPQATDFSTSDFRVVDLRGGPITTLAPTFAAQIQ